MSEKKSESLKKGYGIGFFRIQIFRLSLWKIEKSLKNSESIRQSLKKHCYKSEFVSAW